MLLFLEGGFAGYGKGLFQAEGGGGRVVVRLLVQRHAATLVERRFLQGDGVGQQRLVTVYCEAVGVGMKQGHFTFALGQ